ncbi:Fe(3+) ABC transporter substrate-binding protein [Marinivivus vitaminiproducens]|uniref:Fe(3+) ABC transporter substrate-binding protein n=1 Tax=Marinivivus vitaminiproducens TaxID=3035935 RepID=UPI0027A2FCAC|nr:Fe(3+) ABC transporter substrate-binding protein [Geminicoccaceae bacterium SCSIO 64248]
MHRTLSVTALAALALGGGIPAHAQAQEGQVVNLYSYRQEYLIRPLLDLFEKDTGIQTNVVYASDGILERLRAEGENSPADAILTVDITRLVAHAEADTLQPVESEVLEANVPATYRHPEGLWFGLTARARIFAYAEDRVDPARIATYDALADPELGYTVCTRSGKHPYMQSLTAFMIAEEGVDATRQWAEGLKANLGRKPNGGDRDQVKAVSAGECDLAVLNSYYVGGMLSDEEQHAWMEGVGLVFPNQETTGTHVNISGAGVTKGAKNREAAVRLVEFLSSPIAQRMFAEQNFEYPVTPGIEPAALVESWGDFRRADINLADVADHAAEAARLMDEVDYDG